MRHGTTGAMLVMLGCAAAPRPWAPPAASMPLAPAAYLVCIRGLGQITDLAVAPTGEIAVAGWVTAGDFGAGPAGLEGREQAFVARYRRDGVVHHVHLRPPRRDHADNAYAAVALAADGDAIVVGRQVNNGTVERLGPDGALRWVHEITGEIGRPARLLDVAVAPGGDLVVVGHTAESPVGHVVIARFAPDGTPRWQHALPGHVTTLAVAVGPDGTIVVAGDGSIDAGDGTSVGAYVIGLAPDGRRRWLISGRHVGALRDRLAKMGRGVRFLGIAVAADGMFAVAGEAYDAAELGGLRVTSGRGHFVAWLDGDGAPRAARSIAHAITSIAMSSGGEVILGGKSDGAVVSTAPLSGRGWSQLHRWTEDQVTHDPPAVPAVAPGPDGAIYAVVPPVRENGVYVGCVTGHAWGHRQGPGSGQESQHSTESRVFTYR